MMLCMFTFIGLNDAEHELTRLVSEIAELQAHHQEELQVFFQKVIIQLLLLNCCRQVYFLFRYACT